MSASRTGNGVPRGLAPQNGNGVVLCASDPLPDPVTAEFAGQLPPGLARLKQFRPELFETFERCAAIMTRKAHDYADEDSYRNLRACETMNIPAWKGVLIRLTDKFGRAIQFAKKGEFKVEDEGFADTCCDIINYTAMMLHLQANP